MRTYTNARHWKQEAYGLVQVSWNPEKQLLRGNLELITKNYAHVQALSDAPIHGATYVIVPTSSDCSTPEQIIAEAFEIWKSGPENARQVGLEAL